MAQITLNISDNPKEKNIVVTFYDKNILIFLKNTYKMQKEKNNK